MSYFGGSSDVSVPVGLVLGWNPLGPKSLIRPSADISYRAALQIGLTPLWKSLCFTVLGEIPSLSAISLIVKPSIIYISNILTERLKKVNIFYDFSDKGVDIF